MKKIIFPLSCLALLAACGDEVTEVTERAEIGSVEKYKNLEKCEGDAIGKMVFVEDSNAIFACTKNGWLSLNGADGADGAKGEDGADGTSCTAKETKDKTGIEVSCGGKVIGTIKNGEKGDKGDKGDNGDPGKNGKAGTSCSATALEGDAGIEVKCGETVIDTLKNGANGADGKSAYDLARENDESIGTVEQWLASLKGETGDGCTAELVSNGVNVKCGDAEAVLVKNGANGTGAGCSLAESAEKITITCGSGANEQSVEIAKGYCGDKPYNPVKQFCTAKLEVVNYCGAASQQNMYDPDEQFCDTRDNHLYKYSNYEVGPSGYHKVMDQNLNYYDASNANLKDNSWCGCSKSVCSNEDASTFKATNCNYFGRLYTWAAAKNKSANQCGYNKTCNVADNAQEQGVCPEGWHLMNFNEAKDMAGYPSYWETGLQNGVYVDAQISTAPKYTSYTYQTSWVNGVHQINDDSTPNTFANALEYGSSGPSVRTAYRYYGYYVRCVENY